MSKVTTNIAMSLDGFVAGPRQSRENPLGEGIGDRLHDWMFNQAEENAEVIEQITDAGAFIMGRNMFGPDRGEWDLDWTGWWGDEPPYHAPVFVLAHRERPSITMKGGTVFHFVTDGIHAALDRARAVAGDRDVSVAGGAHTVNQFLAAGLIDELRIHLAPVVIGAGERLLVGVGDPKLTPVSVGGTDLVTHLVYRVDH